MNDNLFIDMCCASAFRTGKICATNSLTRNCQSLSVYLFNGSESVFSPCVAILPSKGERCTTVMICTGKRCGCTSFSVSLHCVDFGHSSAFNTFCYQYSHNDTTCSILAKILKCNDNRKYSYWSLIDYLCMRPARKEALFAKIEVYMCIFGGNSGNSGNSVDI